MNLARALKEKNKLVGKIKVLWERLISSNQSLSDKQDYNAEDLYTEICSETDKLLKLKELINAATQPIFPDILQIAELKGRVTNLKSIQTEEKKATYSDNIITYNVQMSKNRVDELIDKTTKEIEDIQDRIDQFNASTNIDWEP